MQLKKSSEELEVHSDISSRIIANPSHSDGPGNITLCPRDQLALLHDFTAISVSQLVHKPSHLRHSISPCLKAEIVELLCRECASHFGWTERLGRMSGGEEVVKVVVQRGRGVGGHS